MLMHGFFGERNIFADSQGKNASTRPKRTLGVGPPPPVAAHGKITD